MRRATNINSSVTTADKISIHALLAESDSIKPIISKINTNFYPRSPCGERRVTVLGIQHKVGISIHALLAESDARIIDPTYGQEVFLSTLSLRRATVARFPKFPSAGDFYPRSPCGERLALGAVTSPAVMNFYPRSPCGERRRNRKAYIRYSLFLSTLSLRRATTSRLHKILADWDFYPRSPCGERQCQSVHHGADHRISIHALLAESDGWIGSRLAARLPFLSTLSLRRATAKMTGTMPNNGISIHALLAESDDNGYDGLSQVTVFLSTLSLRRATVIRPDVGFNGWISIHALLAESDHDGAGGVTIAATISIHALLAESDDNGYDGLSQVTVFLSTLSLRRAT